jgi:opacity protein-like surface antigen
MKRCARVAMIVSLFASLCLGASRAQAQTAPDSRLSIEITGGPTLGHKSAGFIAGEFGWRLNEKIDVFVEGGHMGNVGTSALDDHADIIANALGLAVGSTGIKVNHFDAGIRFNITPPSPKVHPYVLLGIGFASTTTETTFTLNGTAVDPGIPLGGDLSGSNNKTILLFGGGITYPFGRSYFADFGYRFGGILSKVSDIENDITIKTQRIVFGAGVRF